MSLTASGRSSQRSGLMVGRSKYSVSGYVAIQTDVPKDGGILSPEPLAFVDGLNGDSDDIVLPQLDAEPSISFAINVSP